MKESEREGGKGKEKRKLILIFFSTTAKYSNRSTDLTNSLTSSLYMYAGYVGFILRQGERGKRRNENNFRIFFLTNAYVRYSLTTPFDSLTTRLYYVCCMLPILLLKYAEHRLLNMCMEFYYTTRDASW